MSCEENYTCTCVTSVNGIATDTTITTIKSSSEDKAYEMCDDKAKLLMDCYITD